MTRQTRVVCDGCGRIMLGTFLLAVGAMAVRSKAEQDDPGWHYVPGVPDGIGRDICPACWAEGKR